ncbi:MULTISPECIES: prepilin-type N-terminal cleavage/methylation domain-containing protein [unclassified Exiguobacterium]|uniref:prepilin-type N-terminal cleavage/methylation domain-containing protein n=1 Tax=unclassified Exiguobacterium TaxID=2644629 RepID=UPI00103B5E7E|nr:MULTISPECIES: prepilin-type N-terminal cleavage/methylation domain-containing protein [unclassified Exiguobacterium]TCI73663.1 prepilin-type N-terminal cleavage/methylation domain-containing protein [Exiguobacterium sp. IPCI3]TCI82821.1 prepilin-type N-terminal cleavage/methylation domain-containing protein [Exiguobacterium sp. IPCH1]TCI83875.1 prepilin-type N-terminal cleavage/methylation domain-containing protein [Exiguobacterium sp. IPBC4]
MLEKMKMIWQDAKQLKDERGLTLVELLVVVVILGIIAAIAVVAIGGIIENSKKDAMVSDARQMISSAKLYTASSPLGTAESKTMDFVGPIEDTEIDGTKYLDNLKDPFGTNYSKAEVVITESAGKYTYTVALKGGKELKVGEVTALSEAQLKKDNVK